MALGTPAGIGTLGYTGASVTSSVLTTTGAAAAGQSIFLAGVSFISTTAITGITDSAGNTYSVDVSVTDGTNFFTFLASVHNCLALPSGGTITVSFAAAGVSRVNLSAFTESGTATSSTLDKTAGANQTTATALSVGPTGTTTQAAELAIAVSGVWGAPTGFTAGTGYTALPGLVTSGEALYPEYQVLAATGAQTATGTVTGTVTTSGSVIATYKAAPDPFPAGSQPNPRVYLRT